MGLTAKQTKFCKLYVGRSEDDTLVSLTQAAYPNYNYGSALVEGPVMLRRPLIRAFIDICYVSLGMSDMSLQKELVKIVNQDRDLNAKNAAIKTAAQITGLFENKITLVTEEPKPKNYDCFSDEELAEWERLNKKLENHNSKPIEISGYTVNRIGIDNEGEVQEEPI